MITKTITLSTTDWLKISFNETKDANGFSCWANADIEVSQIPAPAIDQIVPVASGKTFGFGAATDFWIKGAIGTEFYLSPFDSVSSDGGGGSGNCTFDGVYQQPSGHVSGTTCQEWIDLHFPSQPPTMSLRGTPAFGLYEVGETILSPLIEGRGALGGNPAGILTNLSIVDPAFAQANPAPGTWYGTNDANVVITNGTTKTYSGQVDDDQGRSANASGSYRGTLPYFRGKVNGGARPTRDQALIDSGNKVVADSNGNITVPFNSSNTDWLWFAIPVGSTSKTSWFIDALNNGNIGAVTDLFDAEQIVSVDSPTALWAGENYKIYVSTYQSEATTPMQLRN